MRKRKTETMVQEFAQLVAELAVTNPAKLAEIGGRVMRAACRKTKPKRARKAVK